MKRRVLRTRAVYATLALCVCAAPAAVGQTPPAQHPTDSANQYTTNVSVPDLFSDGMLTPPVDRRTQALSANYLPPTPKQQAVMEYAARLGGTAAISLRAGRYADAEAAAREALSLPISPPDGAVEEVLASALDAQGKDQEALQQYQTVVEHYDKQPRNLLPYALLLLKSGQWEQALAAYNYDNPHPDQPGPAGGPFSPDIPQPKELAVALRIALGNCYTYTPDWTGASQTRQAMAEYKKALALDPDSARANYYYGYGWQHLALKGQARASLAPQAKAALQKAAKLGEGDVKKNAEEALKAFAPPK